MFKYHFSFTCKLRFIFEVKHRDSVTFIKLASILNDFKDIIPSVCKSIRATLKNIARIYFEIFDNHILGCMVFSSKLNQMIMGRN